MRAIIIDAKAKTVSEGDHPGDLAALYETIDTNIVEVVRVDSRNDLWLDEEGLLKAADGARLHGFTWGTRGFYGSGVILSHDGEGDTKATTLALDVVQAAVKFFDIDPENLPGSIGWKVLQQ